jgi:hypothetical protein
MAVALTCAPLASLAASAASSGDPADPAATTDLVKYESVFKNYRTLHESSASPDVAWRADNHENPYGNHADHHDSPAPEASPSMEHPHDMSDHAHHHMEGQQ